MRYEGGQYYCQIRRRDGGSCFHMRRRLWKIHIRSRDRCHVEIEFGVTKLPKYDVPDGYTSWEYLNKLCWEGLEERYHPVTEELKEASDL